MSEVIADDQVVSIHYTLRDVDKKIIDSSDGGEPLDYLHGHGQIVAGLEDALHGKPVGAKLSVEVEPADGYGEYDKNIIATVKKTEFPKGAKLDLGEMFEVSDAQGVPMVVRITEVKSDAVVVDGNHPLAGQKLFFEVEVVKIRTATKQELEHGHVHGGGHDH